MERGQEIVAMDVDSNWLVAGSRNGTIAMFDIELRISLTEYPTHEFGPRAQRTINQIEASVAEDRILYSTSTHQGVLDLSVGRSRFEQLRPK